MLKLISPTRTRRAPSGPSTDFKAAEPTPSPAGRPTGSCPSVTMEHIDAIVDQLSTAALPVAQWPHSVIAVRHFVDKFRHGPLATLIKQQTSGVSVEQELQGVLRLTVKQALKLASGPLLLTPAARQARKFVKDALEALIEVITACAFASPPNNMDLMRYLSSRLQTLLPDLAEVTCPICLEVLVDPIALRCGHGMCSHCLTAFRLATPPPRPGTVILTFTGDVMRPVIMSALPAMDDETTQLMNSPPPSPTSPISLERFPTGSSTTSTSSSLGPGPHTAQGRSSNLIAPAAEVVGRPGAYSMTYVSPFIAPAPLDTPRNARNGKGKASAVPARPLMQSLPCPICRCVTRVAAADPDPLPRDKAMARLVKTSFPLEYKRRRDELRREWVMDQLHRLFSVPPGALGPRSPVLSAMSGGARVMVL